MFLNFKEKTKPINPKQYLSEKIKEKYEIFEKK
jgi:hypothetical protein